MPTAPVPLRVTVQFFHPFPRRSQANRVLFQAAREVAQVRARDLYELYPGFSIDVEAEQAQLAESDVVVFQHPFYWYNCPSLMKEWLDAVLERGWAYGPGGDRLQGKWWLQAITTGGPEASYQRSGRNRFRMRELLRPFEQSAKLCGMRTLEPLVLHDTFRTTPEEIRAHAGRYRALLERIARGELPPEYGTEGDPEGRS